MERRFELRKEALLEEAEVNQAMFRTVELETPTQNGRTKCSPVHSGGICNRASLPAGRTCGRLVGQLLVVYHRGREATDPSIIPS